MFTRLAAALLVVALLLARCLLPPAVNAAAPTVIFYPTPFGTPGRTATRAPTPAVIVYATPGVTPTLRPRLTLPSDNRPAWGPAGAAVTIIAFADFECPVCGAFARTIERQLRVRYPEDVRFVFRHFPLRALHAHAQDAALAAECAYRDGEDSFWSYAALLFTHQADFSRPALIALARPAGLRMNDGEFARCLTEGLGAAAVEADLQAGLAAGVRGTPTLFINGVRVEGLQPLKVYTDLIDRELSVF